MSTLLTNLGGTLGFGEYYLTRNDDSYKNGIEVASVFGADGLNFFGRHYTYFSVNNNGNISFANDANSGLSTYTPFGLQEGGYALIAPFFADVDTRFLSDAAAEANQITPTPDGTSQGSNLVWYDLDPEGNNGKGVLTVTWDDVGYYSYATDKLNAFQLQLIGQGNGNFDIVFRYEAVNWTTGIASGGLYGLGGTVARAGYSTGDGSAWYELPQSGNQDAMLSLDTSAGNTGEAGSYLFTVRNSQEVGVLNGTEGDDLLAGSTMHDTIYGFAGNDYLIGNSGDDLLVGGAGDDTYTVDEGDIITEEVDGGFDTIFAATTYTLPNNVEVLRLTGAASVNAIGNNGDNIFVGNIGNNLFDGGDGFDTVDYSRSRSEITVNLTQTTPYSIGGYEGSDTFLRIENLYGSTYSDYLQGNNSENILRGNAGADTLQGNGGNDTLDGGDGVDTIWLANSFSEYTITYNAASGFLQSVHNSTIESSDGIDSLRYVEYLRFSDVLYCVKIVENALELTRENIAPSFKTILSTVASTNEDTLVAITFQDILVTTECVDIDGSITSFNISDLHSGSLWIGADSNSALPYNYYSTSLIDANNNAYWKPDQDANGLLGAFTVVAFDNEGAITESSHTLNVDVLPQSDAPSISIPHPLFDNPLTYSTQDYPTDIALGDLNGDMLKDMVVVNEESNSLSVYINQGDAIFAPQELYFVGNSTRGISFIDINSDEALDIALAINGDWNSYILLLLNNGSGEFHALPTTLPTGYYATSVASGDFNGDQLMDVVVANFGTYSVSVFINNGNNTFTAQEPYLLDDSPYDLVAVDYNEDGSLDLLAASNYGNNISVLKGNGNGGFTDCKNYQVGDNPKALATADFNGDGKSDIAVANSGNNSVSLLLQNEVGEFIAPATYEVGNNPQAITVADLNGDGFLDLLTANYNSNAVSVLLNNGDATFIAQDDYSVGYAPIALASSDVNSDGYADIAVVNYQENSVSVLTNISFLTTFYSGTVPVIVSPTITIDDADNRYGWNNATLGIQISTHADSDDMLHLPLTNAGDGSIWLHVSDAGYALMAGELQIASANSAKAEGDAAWIFTFNGEASSEMVQAVGQAILFSNSNTLDSFAERTVTYTVTDADGLSCSASQTVSVMVDELPPTLLSAYPTHNAEAVSVTETLFFTFSEPITLNSGAITLHAASPTGIALAADISIVGNSLQLDPLMPLQPDVEYFVTFEEKSITDRAGNAFVESISYSFTTESAPILRHALSGVVQFWNSNDAITDVATTLMTLPYEHGSQLVEFHNLQRDDESFSVEVWITPTEALHSVQLHFLLPTTNATPSWQEATGLPSGWHMAYNSNNSGSFALSSMGDAVIEAGSVKLGQLTFAAPSGIERAELLLTSGEFGCDGGEDLLETVDIAPTGIAFSCVDTANDGSYHHFDMLEGSYALQAAKEAVPEGQSAVTAADAYAALQMAANINPNGNESEVLQWQYLAADVNHDGKVRAADALNILKMAVNYEGAPEEAWIFMPDYVAGYEMTRSTVDWSAEEIVVDLLSNEAMSLIGIVRGDVDGSWMG
uniref:Nidogen, extracellular region n=1 Tax=Chlorobium chlorochromatii (strain CaD3) TaxID=340177 RepID=Q3APC8_CHLCH